MALEEKSTANGGMFLKCPWKLPETLGIDSMPLDLGHHLDYPSQYIPLALLKRHLLKYLSSMHPHLYPNEKHLLEYLNEGHLHLDLDDEHLLDYLEDGHLHEFLSSLPTNDVTLRSEEDYFVLSNGTTSYYARESTIVKILKEYREIGLPYGLGIQDPDFILEDVFL